MDRILFIVPPNIRYDDFVAPPKNVKVISKKSGDFGVIITDIPLGVLSLSAYVKKHTCAETRLVDFNIVLNKQETFTFHSFEDFFRHYLSEPRWTEYAPTIIGISALFTPSYQNMLDIARCCREIFPHAVIIAGGGVPTNMYNEIFSSDSSFDALCYGEGEKPLADLVKADDKLGCMENNLSWITRRKIERRESFQHDFIENLDEIPFCDFDIIQTNEYKLNPTISAYPSINSLKQNFPAMTSRGCPHRCCFCASHTVHGRKMRYSSIPRVREDLTSLKNHYGAQLIIFQDDHFMADKQRAVEIIDIINELQMTAFFPNSLALYMLDRKMLEVLKSAGVNQLVLSVESGSERVLKEVMHKPLNLSIIKRVANDCRDLGIYTDVNILIGIPGETKTDIEDAMKFLKTINANWFRINVATPLVGSEMLETCIKKNYLKGNYIDSGFKKAVVETEDFTAEYMQEMAYTMNLELNFVNNSDFRLGCYEMALKGFENAIRAKNDHAIAYYFAAKCYEKRGHPEKARQYMDKACTIVEGSNFWSNYVNMFGLVL